MTEEKKIINDVPETEETKDETLQEEETAVAPETAELSEPQEEKNPEMPMIPLRGLSIFPNMVLHFDIGREKSIKALERAMITNN